MDYGKLSASLSKLIDCLQEREIAGLRKLASSLGETALVENEAAFVEISVAAYATAKLLEKPHFADASAWKKAFPKILAYAKQALGASLEEKPALVKTRLAAISLLIGKASSSAGRFQSNVLEKARLKIGADAYAHGASLGRACELTGAQKESLQAYIGSTRLADKYVTLPAKERMAKVTALFK